MRGTNGVNCEKNCADGARAEERFMRVKVRYRAHLADITKNGEEMVEAATVKDVMRHIGKCFGPDAEKAAKAMIVAVNGESILLLNHFGTALNEGDEISFLPICGGG